MRLNRVRGLFDDFFRDISIQQYMLWQVLADQLCDVGHVGTFLFNELAIALRADPQAIFFLVRDGLRDSGSGFERVEDKFAE